jgi:dihydroorotase
MEYLALEYAKNFDTLIISHCEDLSLKGDMNEGEVSTRLGLKGEPSVSEAIMAERDIMLAEYLKTKVHIAHVSAKETVEVIRRAKKRGVRVTCETAPHYIAGTEEMVIGYDTNTKVNPPMRSEADRLAVIEGIKDGTIDCIVTDHAPHHLDDKRVEYSLAANGISGLEVSFALCYTYLVKAGHINMERLVELMCYKPLEILKQKNDGISEKASADLTLVDLSSEFTIDPQKFVSKGKNNPFGGKKVAGEPVGTVVGGKISYWKERDA